MHRIVAERLLITNEDGDERFLTSEELGKLIDYAIEEEILAWNDSSAFLDFDKPIEGEKPCGN